MFCHSSFQGWQNPELNVVELKALATEVEIWKKCHSKFVLQLVFTRQDGGGRAKKRENVVEKTKFRLDEKRGVEGRRKE